MRVDIYDAEHGWAFSSGADDGCLNVRVYHSGASPEDWDGGEERVTYAEAHSDEIHVCDIPAFIEKLRDVHEQTLRAPRQPG